MVKLYSNVPLPWFQVHVLKFIASKHPGYIMQCHLYKVHQTKPLFLASSCTLHSIQKKRTYFCYDSIGLLRDVTASTSAYDVSERQGNSMIYLPSKLQQGDIVAIEDVGCPKQDEVFLPGLLF